jgi:2-keto-4-pentenoate hydratase
MQDVNALALKLWEARRDGGIVDPADVKEPAGDVEAYAVQDEIVRLSGLPARGFKVGSTSAEAQKLLGTSEPGSGVVTSSEISQIWSTDQQAKSLKSHTSAFAVIGKSRSI